MSKTCYIQPRGPNSRFWVTHYFGKEHRMTPNDFDMQNYQHACYINRRGPNFCPFRSTMGRFQGMAQILWHVHWMTLKWSDVFKVKCTHMHSNPGVQIFIRFTLRWAIFEEIEMFDFPIGQKVKIKLSITLNELINLKIPKRTLYENHHQKSVARVW